MEALAFHHQFAREDYAGCLATCSAATALLSGAHGAASAYSLPFEPEISIPVTNLLHWQYLMALAAVTMRASGLALPSGANQVLDDADRWQRAFQADDRCLWTISEEYEGGGGVDHVVPPYDIDLRVAEIWECPIRDRDRPFEALVARSEN